VPEQSAAGKSKEMWVSLCALWSGRSLFAGAPPLKLVCQRDCAGPLLQLSRGALLLCSFLNRYMLEVLNPFLLDDAKLRHVDASYGTSLLTRVNCLRGLQTRRLQLLVTDDRMVVVRERSIVSFDLTQPPLNRPTHNPFLSIRLKWPPTSADQNSTLTASASGASSAPHSSPHQYFRPKEFTVKKRKVQEDEQEHTS